MLSHHDAAMTFGSCFSDSIGQRMQAMALNVTVNPFGTLYNPLSIAQALNRLHEGTPFTTDELFEHNGLWHSFMHHSRFSGSDQQLVLCGINQEFEQAATLLQQCKTIFITFGTAWVYRLAERGTVVANCHKLPEKQFTRTLLTVEEIVNRIVPTIEALRQGNPNLHIVFTVSPIRHLRDGAHGNQISKATLLLAVDKLCRSVENTSYFPAYEIMLDELRDYRFYADDMVHPSPLAVEYIWQQFSELYLSEKTRALFPRIEKLRKLTQHRPFNTQSSEYAHYLQRIQQLQAEVEAALGKQIKLP